MFAGTLPLPSFHYEVWPQTLLFPNTSIETPAGNLLPYEKFVSPTPDGPSELKTCMERIQDADDFKQIGFKLGDHHATPFHALTLHERSKGQRRRTDSNTVLVGLVHGKSYVRLRSFDSPRLRCWLTLYAAAPLPNSRAGSTWTGRACTGTTGTSPRSSPPPALSNIDRPS